MKRSFAALVIAGSLIFGLCACDMGTMPETDRFEPLNAMLEADYSEVVLTVKNTFDDDTFLESRYVITDAEEGRRVQYTVERFLPLSMENEGEEMKTVASGEAVFRGGRLLTQTGDAADLPSIVGGGLHFEEAFFENVLLSGVRFAADVRQPSAFLGEEIACTGMKAEATFLEVFFDLTVTYLSDTGSAVEMRFVFDL